MSVFITASPDRVTSRCHQPVGAADAFSTRLEETVRRLLACRRRKESPDPAASRELIGQFGVGFYATFMVADKVTLLTRRAGQSEGTRWESAGEDTYVIEPVDDLPQGTTVTVHLKPADSEDQLHD